MNLSTEVLLALLDAKTEEVITLATHFELADRTAVTRLKSLRDEFMLGKPNQSSCLNMHTEFNDGINTLMRETKTNEYALILCTKVFEAALQVNQLMLSLWR